MSHPIPTQEYNHPEDAAERGCICERRNVADGIDLGIKHGFHHEWDCPQFTDESDHFRDMELTASASDYQSSFDRA